MISKCGMTCVNEAEIALYSINDLASVSESQIPGEDPTQPHKNTSEGSIEHAIANTIHP